MERQSFRFLDWFTPCPSKFRRSKPDANTVFAMISTNKLQSRAVVPNMVINNEAVYLSVLTQENKWGIAPLAAAFIIISRKLIPS